MNRETGEALGEQDLPKGWESLLLGEICDIQGGGPALRPTEPAEDGVPMVRPADLRHQRVSSRSAVLRVEPDRAHGLAKYRLLAGDILVARTGTVGRVALVTGEESGWLYNTHLFRVRAKDPTQAPYLLARLSHHSTRNWLERRAAGTTGMRSITLRTLQDLPVLLPPVDRQQEIGAALQAVDEKIRAHEEAVRAAADLRGTLVDLLLSDRLPPLPPGSPGP